jgi:hypothetical protein
MFPRMVKFLALAVGSAAATYCCWQLPSRRIALDVREVSRDQVRITWDRASAPVILANSAEVEIDDGVSFHRVALTGEELRQSSLTYRRETSDVRVRLRIEPGAQWASLAPEVDFTWFRSALAPKQESAPSSATAAAAPIPEENATPAEVPADSEALADAEIHAVSSRRLAVIPERAAALESGNTAVSMPTAPPLELVRPSFSPPPLPLPSPPGVLPAPRPASYTGPQSGRIIWTGSMGRRGVVEIEGSRSSIGSMTGALPGVPVSVRVSPAEFSPGGLVVHTFDAANNGRVESASALNGWNVTVFRWEPDRARELVVLEEPNPSNDFKRLVVRNDARACPVIMVEWAVR